MTFARNTSNETDYLYINSNDEGPASMCKANINQQQRRAGKTFMDDGEGVFSTCHESNVNQLTYCKAGAGLWLGLRALICTTVDGQLQARLVKLSAQQARLLYHSASLPGGQQDFSLYNVHLGLAPY